MEAGKIRIPRTRIREGALEPAQAPAGKGKRPGEAVVTEKEWCAVRTKLLQALDRHPEAREEVLRVFVEAEENGSK